MSDRVIVFPSWGPQAFKKAVLQPGERLRIGQVETAGFRILPVPHLGDRNAEAEFSWDGNVARIRAITPGQTIVVDGQSVDEGQLGHLSWFKVGETTFLCTCERQTERRDSPDPQRSALQGQVLKMLCGVANLYAVLDSARDDRILELLRESPNETRSLYEGPRGDAFAESAPYLVRLAPEDWLLETLVIEGWGQSWGIYLACGQTFKEVRRHFRRFLRVQREGGPEYLYFRFYDPRVLRNFLPTCNNYQLQQIFGPIASFWMEDRDATPLQFMPPSLGTKHLKEPIEEPSPI